MIAAPLRGEKHTKSAHFALSLESSFNRGVAGCPRLKGWRKTRR